MLMLGTEAGDLVQCYRDGGGKGKDRGNKGNRGRKRHGGGKGRGTGKGIGNDKHGETMQGSESAHASAPDSGGGAAAVSAFDADVATEGLGAAAGDGGTVAEAATVPLQLTVEPIELEGRPAPWRDTDILSAADPDCHCSPDGSVNACPGELICLPLP